MFRFSLSGYLLESLHYEAISGLKIPLKNNTGVLTSLNFVLKKNTAPFRRVFDLSELTRPYKVDQTLDAVEKYYRIFFGKPNFKIPNPLRKTLYFEDGIIRTIDDIFDGDNISSGIKKGQYKDLIKKFKKKLPFYSSVAKLFKMENGFFKGKKGISVNQVLKIEKLRNSDLKALV